MKARNVIILAVLLVHSPVPFAVAQAPPKLTVDRGKVGIELSWPGPLAGPNGAGVRPFFELQRSTDLRDWRPFGERLRAPVSATDQLLSAALPPSEPLGFFR